MRELQVALYEAFWPKRGRFCSAEARFPWPSVCNQKSDSEQFSMLLWVICGFSNKTVMKFGAIMTEFTRFGYDAKGVRAGVFSRIPFLLHVIDDRAGLMS
jgi:hypothetical protein